MNADVRAKAVRVLRRLAAVAQEYGELARELGAEREFEAELAKLWRSLAAAVEGGVDVLALGVAGPRDPWAEKPSALTFWGNLSDRQQAGADCLICGAIISGLYPGETMPGEPSAVINGKQTFVHRDPGMCTATLAEKIEKEIPF